MLILKQRHMNLLCPKIVLALTVAFSSCSSQAKTDYTKDSKAAKLDVLISKYAEYGKFNGSVLVAENGEIIYKKGFGMASVKWEIPNQSDTKFRLASVTKQFTAML